MYLEKPSLYFVPKFGEFFKIQPGTDDNLSADDVAAGYTDYIIWNRFRTGELDIDGELDMECVDSGMFMFADSTTPAGLQEGSFLDAVMRNAYGEVLVLQRLI